MAYFNLFYAYFGPQKANLGEFKDEIQNFFLKERNSFLARKLVFLKVLGL